ncbi:MAG: prepilin-type N-terminal cleavage/methylation domain-containing protein [Bacilli bacterium]|nr:prepilin-type N-terminal cleavage/methylation domain-containing protein [Bacilli bacterium]
MKKRGFTLTEVLGVIVILGLIALIIFPNVSKSIKNSKQKLYNEQVSLIEENARKWGVEHTAELPDNGSYYLELNDLVLGGYISQKELKDPRDDSTMEGCIVISYDPSYNQYQYLYTTASCEEQRPVEKPSLVEKVNNASDTATNDPDGNRRYVGENPNNYVRFNNELWRIIGVFDGQVKIMKNDFYSTGIAWDTNRINDWSTASLQTELNTTYWDTIDSNYQNMVDQNHVWNLGGAVSTTWTRANLYNMERGTAVYNGRPTTWMGKVGLMYPSDYGYSTSSTSSECDLDFYNSWSNYPDCYNNSWTYNSSYHQLTITPSDVSIYVLFVNQNGNVNLVTLHDAGRGVRPVLYLKSDVKVESGSGSNTNPFNLSL